MTGLALHLLERFEDGFVKLVIILFKFRIGFDQVGNQHIGDDDGTDQKDQDDDSDDETGYRLRIPDLLLVIIKTGADSQCDTHDRTADSGIHTAAAKENGSQGKRK